MLEFCVGSFSSAGLQFNVEKCIATICGTNLFVPKCLGMFGVDMIWCDALRYLGIKFLFGKDIKADISERLRKFTTAVVGMLREPMYGYKMFMLM